MAGLWPSRSSSSSSCRRKASWIPIGNRRCSIRPTSSLARPRARSFRLIERTDPAGIVVDSLSEFRLLAQSSLRYRRQILALKHFFARHGTTVLLLDDLTAETLDKTVHSVAHGVIRLEELAPELRRRAAAVAGHQISGASISRRLPRFRHQARRAGVFPRLSLPNIGPSLLAPPNRAASEPSTCCWVAVWSAGSSALFLGPAGAGKSLLALQFAAGAVGAVSRLRCSSLMKNSACCSTEHEHGAGYQGHASIRPPACRADRRSGDVPGRVRARGPSQCCERCGASTMVIDSLNGYQAAMPEEQSLILHMHELLQFLNRQGATTFLTVAQHGLVGEMKAPVDVTYLADTVLLLRYFEASGECVGRSRS